MKTIPFILLVILGLIGCSRKMYEFELLSCDKFKDCKETVKKTFQLQEADRAPNSIVVTDEYIAWTKVKIDLNLWTEDRVAIPMENTVYFDKITNLSMIHTTRYVIKFINKTNKRETVIVLYDKDAAEQGYSAIKCMIDASINKQKDGLY